MQDKLRIDLETGLMIESVHPSQVGDDIIETPCLIPHHLPKWTESEWVEGATEIPTPQVEVVEKDLEQRVVSIEETLDVLLGGSL